MKIILMPNAPRMTARHYCIAKSLSAQGHEVHYIDWELPYGIPAAALLRHFFTALRSRVYTYEEFTVHKFRRLPFFWPYINGWLFKMQTRKLYKSISADFIFAEGYTNETEMPKDLPFIYDLADDYAAYADIYGSAIFKFAFKILGVRGVMKRQCINALSVTAVSAPLIAYARKYNQHVLKLPNGVNADIVRVVKAARHKHSVNPYSLVYASGFGRWSHVVETMQTVTKLRHQFPKLELTLIGDGTEVDAIHHFIREHNAEDYIHYLGFVSDQKELFSLINQHAIGLNISDKNKWRNASHPMKVMDYTALGKKVISTDLSEIVALSYENIFLFNNTQDSFRHALRQAIRTKPIDGSYDALSKIVLTTHSWDRLTNTLLQEARNRLSTHSMERILHVTPSYPPRLGGLEKVVQVLARTQASLGYRISVLTSNQAAKTGYTFENVPITRLRSLIVANTTIMPALFLRLLQLRANDIVHLHITQAYTPEMVWLASKIRKFSYLAHMHLDVPVSGRFGFLLKYYKKYLLGRVLRAAKYVVVFTEDQKAFVKSYYSVTDAKIHIIPNGVEEVFYYTAARTAQKQTHLLFVGRLDYQKNLMQLLNALRKVSQKFQTTIVGEGEQEAELRAAGKDLKLHNVTFAGRADGSTLLNYYKSADIFVLPSEREGMPLALLEAIAMGLPIIATNVTGNRDVVQDSINGLLVPYKDASALRGALVKLATDKTLYNTLHTGALASASKYKWDKIAYRFLKLYRSQA